MNLTYSPSDTMEKPLFPVIRRHVFSTVLIIAIHFVFFLALRNGLDHIPVLNEPREIQVALIAPEHREEAVSPPKAEPKTVPIVKRTPPPAAPPAVVRHVESKTAISEPAPPPAPPAPVQPVVQAAPALPAPVTAPTATPDAAAKPAGKAAAPAAPKTITVGVEYLSAPQPVYPAVSRRMGEEGKVVMRVLIDESGRAQKIEISTSSGSSRLDDAAVSALSKARFRPYSENGQAQAVYALVPINFQLSN